jgi:hypothetical protein
MLLHVLKVINHLGMMGNTVDNMNIGKIFKPLARKVRALKTPGNFMLASTLAKAVRALLAEGHYSVRKTTVTANFFRGYSVLLGDPF